MYEITIKVHNRRPYKRKFKTLSEVAKVVSSSDPYTNFPNLLNEISSGRESFIFFNKLQSMYSKNKSEWNF